MLETGAVQDAIFRSARLCCIATDETGAILILSAGAERMLGYTAADLRGKTLAHLCDPAELTPGFEALVRNASRGNEEDVFALTFLRKDGSRLPAAVSVSALRGAAEAIAGYLFIGTDDSARRQAEEAPRGPAGTRAAADPSKPVVLVIDDDDRAVEVLRLFLEVEGFAVVHSSSAEEALLEAPRHRLALITLDLQMPGLDGWQFLERLRENSALSEVPVIIASGEAADQRLARSRSAGAVLQKPIGRAALKAALGDLGLLKFRGGFSG
jgi:PAS domain S-box-containing protein